MHEILNTNEMLQIHHPHTGQYLDVSHALEDLTFIPLCEIARKMWTRLFNMFRLNWVTTPTVETFLYVCIKEQWDKKEPKLLHRGVIFY